MIRIKSTVMHVHYQYLYRQNSDCSLSWLTACIIWWFGHSRLIDTLFTKGSKFLGLTIIEHVLVCMLYKTSFKWTCWWYWWYWWYRSSALQKPIYCPSNVIPLVQSRAPASILCKLIIMQSRGKGFPLRPPLINRVTWCARLLKVYVK